MVYLERAPKLSLRPWIRSLWYCRAPVVAHSRERVLPNGCSQIVLNLARNYLTDCRNGLAEIRIAASIIVGARQRYEVINTGDLAELAGIVIEPGGFAQVFRERADLFFERSTPLNELWTHFKVERIAEAETPATKLDMLEVLLQKQVGEPANRLPVVDGALLFLACPSSSVRDCAKAAGISERRLFQVFREQVGVSPKLWCRIRRFQTAVKDLHRGVEIPWAELALRCGYYDQAHFINDFRAFSGLNPLRYSSLRGPWRNHIPQA